MAAPWLAILKLVPWRDVISNAPKVAEGAKKLWSSVAKKSDAAAASASGPPYAIEVLDTDAQAIARLQRQVAVHKAEIAALHEQLLAGSALVQQLADQHLELIARMERQRKQLRWLTAAVLLLSAALGVTLVRVFSS